MAEAVVEDRPLAPMRYFCHMCKVDINIPNSDFTCPLCAGGFIEELPSARNEANTNSGGRRDRRGEQISAWHALRDDLTTLLMSRNASNFELSFGDDGSRRISITGGGGGGGGGGNEGQGSGGGGGTTSNNGANQSRANTGGGRVRPQNFDRFDNVLMDFLQTLTLSDGDGPFGGSQFIFMGNPGDYAWGREGIDTIVTQLLNQMDTSGPPPLSKEKIDEIPVEKISNEEIKNKLQCSVCWEDFKIDEDVRRLPCAHIYHEACIIPWLKLHNTCPICRKSLADETETEQQGQGAEQRPTGGDGSITVTHSGGPSNSIRMPFLASLYTSVQEPINRRNQSNNSSSNGSNATSQDNVFSFENSNHDDMDLD